MDHLGESLFRSRVKFAVILQVKAAEDQQAFAVGQLHERGVGQVKLAFQQRGPAAIMRLLDGATAHRPAPAPAPAKLAGALQLGYVFDRGVGGREQLAVAAPIAERLRFEAAPGRRG